MIAQLTYHQQTYTADLSHPIDISIPLGQVRCFFAPDLVMVPYQSGDFIGAVKAGGAVNTFNVTMNPHGNGTHTECIGHITPEQQSVNRALRRFHFVAALVSVEVQKLDNGDEVISQTVLQEILPENLPEALIIRTLPNDENKVQKDYSATNPPYVEGKAMEYLVNRGIKHLLIDLPSVDKEEDGGALTAHNIFWQTDRKKRLDCTITELIYVPNQVADGLYLLNLSMASLELDASPSKPVIYSLQLIK